MKRRNKKQGYIRDLVIQRINILYEIAVNETRKGNIEYARMLTSLIKRLSTRNRVRVPRKIKRSICKKCGVILIPGRTSRVRLVRDGKTSRIVITCKECGWIHRYPFKPQRGSDN